MAGAKAFGSITITDITDVGRLSAYITSSQPQTVIQNPNNGSFTPDWSKSNLVLTPIIYFNENQLTLPKTGLSVKWKRKEGSSAEAELIQGETVNNGVLTVSKNFLGQIQSGIITYIVTVSYTDPSTNVTLETQAQMSFSLSRQATEAKYCSILGESVFLYNTNQAIHGASEITLTASCTNVSVSQWQYKNSTEEFVAMTTTNNPAINGNTIKIKAAEDVLFNNDVCVIKLVTSDSSVYDLHTITKIRDGAAGNNATTIVLSNEDHTLPCDASGHVISYQDAETSINIFSGGVDETSKWNIQAKPSQGITGSLSGNTYTVTAIEREIEVGHVEFVCTRSGFSNQIKRFTLVKQKAGHDGANGQDAVVYSLKTSTLTLNLGKDNNFTPRNVDFSGMKQVGNQTSQTVYNGRFKIYESTDGVNFTNLKYTSSADEASHTYTPSSTSVKGIRCEMYAAGGTSTKLDTQTVMITKDGHDGQNGHDGAGGISFGIGNEAEVIPCNPNGTVKVQKTITIPFYAYKGIQRIAVTCSKESMSLPSGVTSSITQGTTSSDGVITITIPAGNTLGTASELSGNFAFTLVADGVSVQRKFSWTKSIQSTNAILFQIFAPKGDVIINGKNSVELDTQLSDGNTIINSGITYQWSKFNGTGGYTVIDSQVNKKLTVTPSMVDSLASFKCTANYAGKSYDAYWSVTDKNDPIDLQVLCSVGTQLTNKTPFGVVYTLAYLNGIEVDAIKSTRFLTSAPTQPTPTNGDFYYHIDTVAKSVTLKKYDGSAWQNASENDLPKGKYAYYRRQDGVELDKTEPWKEGKAVYVDRDIVKKNLLILCEGTNIPMS